MTTTAVTAPATTLEKFAGQRAGNYCTNPRIDVPILPDVHHCTFTDCDREVEYVPNNTGLGSWTHVDGDRSTVHRDAVCDVLLATVQPRLRCRYCHTEDPTAVRFRFVSYSDETSCTRCGGVDGRPTGD